MYKYMYMYIRCYWRFALHNHLERETVRARRNGL